MLFLKNVLLYKIKEHKFFLINGFLEPTCDVLSARVLRVAVDLMTITSITKWLVSWFSESLSTLFLNINENIYSKIRSDMYMFLYIRALFLWSNNLVYIAKIGRRMGWYQIWAQKSLLSSINLYCCISENLWLLSFTMHGGIVFWEGKN